MITCLLIKVSWLLEQHCDHRADWQDQLPGSVPHDNIAWVDVNRLCRHLALIQSRFNKHFCPQTFWPLICINVRPRPCIIEWGFLKKRHQSNVTYTTVNETQQPLASLWGEYFGLNKDLSSVPISKIKKLYLCSFLVCSITLNIPVLRGPHICILNVA